MRLAGPLNLQGTLKLNAEGWAVEAPFLGRAWTFQLEIAPLPDLQLSPLTPFCEWTIGTPVEIYGAAVWRADSGIIGRIDQTRRNESRPL